LRCAITKSKYLVFVIVLVMLLQFSTFVQKTEARLTSTLYSMLKYHDRHLHFMRIEFDSHFGEYLITYRDSDGEIISFMVKYKYFPFIVSFDPLEDSL
jgi:hypothetical protein